MKLLRYFEGRFFVFSRWWAMLGNEYLVSLAGDKPGTMQRGVPTAVVPVELLWRRLSIWAQLRICLLRRWKLDKDAVQEESHRIFLDDLFGEEVDFGPTLMKIAYKHCQRRWNLDNLSDSEHQRALAVEAQSILVRQRLKRIKSWPPLNLQLANRVPWLSPLFYAMSIKVPIYSVRFAVDVHASFVFAKIKESAHDYTDSIISYLYECLLSQHRVALAMYDLIEFADSVRQKKDKVGAIYPIGLPPRQGSLLLGEEVDAIRMAEICFTHLKANVEKTIALLGLCLSIPNLDDKKTHRARLAALKNGMSEKRLNTPYMEFLLFNISSDSLEELNRYRSGILHKKGIADLQPHNYIGQTAHELPLKSIFEVIHEQHTVNTILLICTLAVLTDVLVDRTGADEDWLAIF